MRWTRRSVVGVLGLAMMGLAACGAGSATAKTPAAVGGNRPTPNPAMRAALEIIRLQPVVPFSPQQVQQLVPILQSLSANPNPPQAQLTAKAQQIEAVFTATQKTALSNMASNGAFGPGGRGGASGPGGTRGTAGPAGGAGGGQGRFRRFSGASGSGPGAGRTFSPSSVYQLAIQTLQGTAPARGSSTAASSSSSSASASA